MTYKPKISQSIGDIIIATIMSNKNIAEFHKIINQREFSRFKKESVRMTLSRLHKNGYLDNTENGWSITKKGKAYGNRNMLFSFILSPFDKNKQSNTIVSFDITETNRIKRNWLRNQLKVFTYKMLQQSLWIGPGPLPQEFLKRLNELDIRENIKIFTISKKEI